MGISLDYQNRVVVSDSSITDIVVFHKLLREVESSLMGILYPVVHTYKETDIGSGAVFPAIAFVNGWTLQFPAGNWEISGGNLSVEINPVDDCYVKQTQAAAYAVPSGGLTAADAAAAVWEYTR